MRIAGACLVSVALASPPSARADDLSRVDSSPRWEGAFGMRVGSFHVGSFAGTGFGFHLDGGERFDRLLLYGEYSYLSISNAPAQQDTAQLSSSPPAMMELDRGVQRVRVNARYSVGKITGEEVPPRGDVLVA